MSGTFQWKGVQTRVALKDADRDVVLVWAGPLNEWNEKAFVNACQAWGLKSHSRPIFSAGEKTLDLLEKSALAGIE